jgi:cytochrome c oxidase subunit 2
MPHFRAQMNCVPGMVTEFGFTPKYTTEEMRQQPEVVAKTKGINKLRSAKGEELYEFDYLLLCNKICGASHYNMQMKITVVEQDEYDEWISKQPTLASVLAK